MKVKCHILSHLIKHLIKELPLAKAQSLLQSAWGKGAYFRIRNKMIRLLRKMNKNYRNSHSQKKYF